VLQNAVWQLEDGEPLAPEQLEIAQRLRGGSG
jgi:hypothetical protein